MNFQTFLRIIAFASVLLHIGHRTAGSQVPDNNNPSAGLFGHLNIPTGLLEAVPAQSLLSGVNLDGRSQPLVPANLGSHNGEYQSNGQSKQVEDLIGKLSAALLSSLNTAAIQNEVPQGSQGRSRSLALLANPQQRDYVPPLYSSYPQGYAPYQPSSYAPYQLQQGYPQIFPQAQPHQSYGSGPVLPPNQPYSYGARYSPYGSYSPYAPPSSAGEFYGQPPNYGYGISPPQRPPAPYPMSHSENQFGYGVNAGVYAGTYGGSSASATPDGGQLTSYGGLTPWTIINGGNSTPTNSTRPRSNGSRNGSVVPISIIEATADEASEAPAAGGDNTTNTR